MTGKVGNFARQLKKSIKRARKGENVRTALIGGGANRVLKIELRITKRESSRKQCT
jgi:hypothetical protein